MRVVDIEVADTPRGARVHAPIDWEVPGVETEPVEFFYLDRPASFVTGAGDMLLAASLIPAMRLGTPLTVGAPVSRRLLHGARAIVDIWSGWNKTLKRIPIEAPVADRSSDRRERIGSLFSCGVDSSYTLLKHRRPADAIDTLITIHGYDVERSDTEGFAFLRERVERVADEMHKDCLFVETNAGSVGTQFVNWDLLQGAFLAACALGCGDLRRCYIASTRAYRFMRPWGSHPFVDPLWSTESLEFVHDGAEFTRSEKVLAIADSQLVLDTLRVCNYEVPNCRRCATCLATMLALDVAKALERSPAIGPDIPLRDLAKLRLPYGWIEDFTELFEAVREPRLRRVIGRLVRRSRRRRRYVAPIGRQLRARTRPLMSRTGAARSARNARHRR